jgi:GNAT superfamily N-acetyltransferase
LRGATIHRIGPGDDTALANYVRIRNAVAPENSDSLEQLAWQAATYPGDGARFLAVDADGIAVGTATTGRIWMYGPEYPRWWLGIWVLPHARRRGHGSALYSACGDAARAAGKTGFDTELSAIHEEGLRFLAHRGFVETDRSRMVRLDLAGLAAPDPRPPAGVRLVTLADRPDLLPGVHATAIEAFPDIPHDGEPLSALDLDGFTARDVTRPGIPKDAFFVAVAEATGDVAGYASLIYDAASSTVAYHDMTAVRRAYRGRGIATALKQATIAWAVEHGLEALDTGNDVENAPMRAVNLALGYRPLPDWIGLQGPLASLAPRP